jgi:hypothetical protein
MLMIVFVSDFGFGCECVVARGHIIPPLSACLALFLLDE